MKTTTYKVQMLTRDMGRVWPHSIATVDAENPEQAKEKANASKLGGFAGEVLTEEDYCQYGFC